MKKKLIALVAAALTVSAASVFASPTISGDTNLEYNNNKSMSDSTLTSETNVNLDANFLDNLNLHTRFTANYDADNDHVYNTAVSQLFVNTKVNDVNLSLGKQPLYLGQGLLADVVGINGVQLNTNLGSTAFTGFHGKDGETVTAVDLASNVGTVKLGASYLKKGDAYYGINASHALADNVVGNVEFVKNSDSEANGFLAQVKFGAAQQKGDVDYVVSYRDIEDGAVNANYTTEANYNDSKGFRFGANYKAANNGTLSAYYDAVDAQSGLDKSETHVEYKLNF
jgi:hypothetical protein